MLDSDLQLDPVLLTDAARRATELGDPALTERIARRRGRPVLVLDTRSAEASAIRNWIDAHAVARLNVAGPRESRSPGIYETACRLLRAAWSDDYRERSQ